MSEFDAPKSHKERSRVANVLSVLRGLTGHHSIVPDQVPTIPTEQASMPLESFVIVEEFVVEEIRPEIIFIQPDNGVGYTDK